MKQGANYKTKIYRYILSRKGEKNIETMEYRILVCCLNEGTRGTRASGGTWEDVKEWVACVTPDNLKSEFTEHEIMELLLEEE